MSQKAFTIGTRGSPLALYQARLVQSLLCEQTGRDAAAFPIETFTTSGDTIKGDLKEFGGKGLFTKELETALLDGRIDMAVHSMKDVPTDGQAELHIAAILERSSNRDALISVKYKSLDDLPQGALIGTASIRRRAQLSAARPDLKFTLLRGNVGTRLKKLEAGECDATILAAAGLRRLEQVDVITELMPAEVMLPAPAQGAIGVECRKDDKDTTALLSGLNHLPTWLSVTAERAFLKALDGDCRTPIAALSIWTGYEMRLYGQVLSMDGSFQISDNDVAHTLSDTQQAYDLGWNLGQKVKAQIGDRVLWA